MEKFVESSEKFEDFDIRPCDKTVIKYGCYNCKHIKSYTIKQLRERDVPPMCKCGGFFRILTYPEEVRNEIPVKDL